MASDSPNDTEGGGTVPSPPMPRLDLVSGAAFSGLGLFLAVESWRMARLEHRDISPYTVPGMVPGVLGVIVLVLGLVLLARAAAKGGWRLRGEGDASPGSESGGAAGKLMLTLALTLGYAAGLVGRVPFAWATFVFLFLFVLIFEWNQPAGDGNRYALVRRIDAVFIRAFGETAGLRVKTGVAAALLAAVVSIGVMFVFQEVFRIRLP